MISVVIPVKDDAGPLERCLAAITQQLHPGDELVVVDNGSSDGSATVARRFHARIITVSGGGIPAAAAAGYDAAAGTIVARTDADAVPAPDWLERIRVAFGRDELCALTGGATFLDGPRWLRVPLAGLYLGAYFGSLYPLLGHVPLFGSNLAFRRADWAAVRLQVHRTDAFVHDDLDLAFHLGPRRSIRFDRRMGMRISMRPFFDSGSFGVRLRRGMHTVVVHLPDDAPWFRWPARVRSPLSRRSALSRRSD